MSTYRLEAEAVLNGIAYDAATQRLFVTGKLWPRLFEIQVVSKTPAGGQRSQ
jgi:glutamine cyclotransferase